MARGPHTGDPLADSLWILNTHSAAELRTLIADCGRELRNGGTLIIGTDPSLPDDGASRLKNVLACCGYVLENESRPFKDFGLLCLRKQASPSAALAA